MGMGSKMEGTSAPANRRDPYEVLSVSRDSTDQEIKTAYRRLALKYVSFLPIFHFLVSFLFFNFNFNFLFGFEFFFNGCFELWLVKPGMCLGTL